MELHQKRQKKNVLLRPKKGEKVTSSESTSKGMYVIADRAK